MGGRWGEVGGEDSAVVGDLEGVGVAMVAGGGTVAEGEMVAEEGMVVVVVEREAEVVVGREDDRGDTKEEEERVQGQVGVEEGCLGILHTLPRSKHTRS